MKRKSKRKLTIFCFGSVVVVFCALQDKLAGLGSKDHPLELRDWSDLWHSSLKGKIALPNSPRLLVEITLRSFGRDFNSASL